MLTPGSSYPVLAGVLLACLTLAACGRMSDPTTDHDTDWRIEAEQRIAEHRQGDFSLQLQVDGRAYTGPVHIEQIGHHFGFGTCVNGTLFRDNRHGERYRAFIRKHFNMLVSENSMKWYTLEKDSGVFAPDRADRQLAWAEEHGMRMRGHCLLWSKQKFVQEWVQELPRDELWPRIEAHLQKTLAHFDDRVICWDGVNEMLDGDWYQQQLGEDFNKRAYLAMNAAAPDMPIYPNEYSIIDNDEKCDRYLALIEELQAAGVKLGGIGVQEHAAERFERAPRVAEAGDTRPERQRVNPLIPREVWARLDRLGATGLPVHLTEVSFRSYNEERKAEALEDFYITCFAHPAVEAILLWGFWERAHWLGRHAALVDKDWNELPAAAVLDKLLNQTWRTRLQSETADGSLTFRGFYGRYRLTAGSHTAEVDLTPEQASSSITLTP